MNNEAARPSAVEETLVKTEQQLYFSEVLLYFIVLYCTVLHCTVLYLLYCTVLQVRAGGLVGGPATAQCGEI